MLKLKGMRVAVLANTNSQEYEVWYLLMRMLEEGAEVYIVGQTEVQAYSNHNSHSIRMDSGLSTVLSAAFDAVIVPGIYTSNWPAEEEAMLRIIERAIDRNALVAMICSSEWIPVSGELFDGREVTCSKTIQPLLASAGAKCVEKTVVKDGNLITASRKSSLEDFSQAIVDHLMIENIGGSI